MTERFSLGSPEFELSSVQKCPDAAKGQDSDNQGLTGVVWGLKRTKMISLNELTSRVLI